MSTKIMMAAIVLGLAGTAAAQEDPFGKAMEGAPPAGRPAGEMRVPEAPGSTDAPRPLAPQAARPVFSASDGPAGSLGGTGVAPVGPAGATAGGPRPNSAEDPDAAMEIHANLETTEQIYKKILENQDTDLSQMDKRIAANEEIVARYRPELQKNEEELRKIQVEFMNRAFQLRQQRDMGQMNDDQFQKAVAVEEGKWNRKKAAIAGDVTFFREEISQAEVRLADYRAKKRTSEERIRREGKEKPKPKPPGDALFDGFNGQLEKLSGFQTRFTMDGVGTPDMWAPRQAPAAQPALEQAKADAKAAEQPAAEQRKRP